MKKLEFNQQNNHIQHSIIVDLIRRLNDSKFAN